MYELTLKDFEYKINGNNLVFLKLLNNNESNIELLDKYTIDGKDYIVNEIGEKALASTYILTNVFDKNFFLKNKKINLKLPDTIEKIGYGAFQYSNLEKINIPEKVTEIPEGCFCGCKSLKKVELSENINIICKEAFYDTGIEKFTCPINTIKIEEECFYDCKELIEFNLSENVMEIGNLAFGNTKIKNFNFSSKVKCIPTYVFASCENLEKVSFNNNIKQLGAHTFLNSGIKEIEIPKNVNNIPQSCFEGCANLDNIVLHDNIKTIEKYAFAITAITKFSFPYNVKKIPQYCFLDCKKLKEINLNNVKFIEKDAFENCKKLNISYQNNIDIYIDDYNELKEKGFIDAQINQIFKGYEKLIFLNNLSNDIPSDIFRLIVSNFDKVPKQFSDIIRQLENNSINLNDKLELYDKINKLSNDKNLNDEEIDHTI